MERLEEGQSWLETHVTFLGRVGLLCVRDVCGKGSGFICFSGSWARGDFEAYV